MRRISVTPPRSGEGTLPAELARRLPFRVTDALCTVTGRVEEIRLRRGRQMSVTVCGGNLFLPPVLDGTEMDRILCELADGSLYAYEDTLKEGYLALPDGIRVGVAGSASVSGGRITGISGVSALCIRLPGHVTVSGQTVRDLLDASDRTAGVLIWSPPGEGKTTLLKAAAVAAAGGLAGYPALRTVVVDTRGELVISEDGGALALDILRGYPKAAGIGIACRTLNAEVILCDEIGAGETEAILASVNCGVPLIATAHAGDVPGLLARPGFAALHRARVFGYYLGIRKDGRGGFRETKTTWEAANDLQMDRRVTPASGGRNDGVRECQT